MAERNGPTDGARFTRAAPSGNHKGEKKRRKSKSGKELPHLRGIDLRAGETLWTQELQDKLVRYILAGNYAEVAARACGINKATFHEWLLKGGRGIEPFRALADAVESAAAQAEVRDVVLIGEAAKRQWQAAAWRLERKNYKRWGRKDALELAGNAERPLQVNVMQWGADPDDTIEF